MMTLISPRSDAGAMSATVIGGCSLRDRKPGHGQRFGHVHATVGEFLELFGASGEVVGVGAGEVEPDGRVEFAAESDR